MSDTTYGNASITHTFIGFGTFKLCMLVHRTDPTTGASCEFQVCKALNFFSTNLTGPGTVEVFPNPSKGRFILQADQPWPNQVEIRVFNPYGQMIRDWTTQPEKASNRIPVELTDLDRGMYLLEIRSEGRKWVKKVVIQ